MSHYASASHGDGTVIPRKKVSDSAVDYLDVAVVISLNQAKGYEISALGSVNFNVLPLYK